MENSTKVVKLLPHGDPIKGLTKANIAGDVIEGNPVEAVHRFYVGERSEVSGLRVGVYEGSAYAEKVVDFPCDEFMYLVEGTVTIVDQDGSEQQFQSGEAFFMPKGFTGIWRQSNDLKKFHMTVC